MLLASVRRPAGPEQQPEQPELDVATKAEPEAGDVTQTDDTVTEHRDVGADAAAGIEPDPEVEQQRPEPGAPPR
jgi:hypothetical protein